jgi:hypothetical protein
MVLSCMNVTSYLKKFYCAMKEGIPEPVMGHIWGYYKK